MPDDTKPFEQFFAEKIKEKGISLKRLADVTGIAPAHIESLLRGDYEEMPSSPYFHGYLLRLGKALDFNSDEWWLKLQKAKLVNKSGESDTLPDNRFLKQAPPKYVWAILVAAIVLIYFALQAPRIIGKPTLDITYPQQNPFTTSSSTFTIEGTIANADSLTLNGDPITIAPDGTWQKTVLLQGGKNDFQITGKKFLGRETNVVEQIFYASTGAAAATTTPATETTTSTAASGTPAVHFSTETQATGTFSR